MEKGKREMVFKEVNNEKGYFFVLFVCAIVPA